MTTTTPKTSYLFIVTHYDSDADRAATPLVLANNALAAGADVLLWLTADGAEFGKKGAGRAGCEELSTGRRFAQEHHGKRRAHRHLPAVRQNAWRDR